MRHIKAQALDVIIRVEAKEEGDSNKSFSDARFFFRLISARSMAFMYSQPDRATPKHCALQSQCVRIHHIGIIGLLCAEEKNEIEHGKREAIKICQSHKLHVLRHNERLRRRSKSFITIFRSANVAVRHSIRMKLCPAWPYAN